MLEWFIGRAFSPRVSGDAEHGVSPHAGIGRAVGAGLDCGVGAGFVGAGLDCGVVDIGQIEARRKRPGAKQAAEKPSALKGRGFSRAITTTFPMWL